MIHGVGWKAKVKLIVKDPVSHPGEFKLVFLARESRHQISNMARCGFCRFSLASVQRNNWVRKRETLARILKSYCSRSDERC